MSLEFAVCDGIVLVLLTYELISIRRTIRKDREAARARETQAAADATATHGAFETAA